MSRPDDERPYPVGLSTIAHLQSPEVALAPPRRVTDSPRSEDARLLRALHEGDERAPVVLFRRFAGHVERIVTRIFGVDADVSELVNETFFRAIERVRRVSDPESLRAWLTSIAVRVAHERLRYRRRRWWLRLPGGPLPEVEAPTAPPEVVDTVRRVYRTLEEMPASERIAFAFRFIEGMELSEIASACGVSLATIKRTLARAEDRFVALGRRDPLLRERLEGGARWSTR